MPTPSAEPLRVQVINRIAAKLAAITAGADYWYTPARVEKRYIPTEEIHESPIYMVFAGTGEGQVTPAAYAGADTRYWEDVLVTIQGVVKSDTDTATIVGRCIRDIRKALDADTHDKLTAGTLGYMGVEALFERAPITDNGWFQQMAFGRFELFIRVRTEGTFAEL